MEWLELALRFIFGAQMFFWGMNGFFNWVKIPPSSKIIDRFVESCIETRFIMPLVKIIEIAGGALIVLGIFVLPSLMVFAPLMTIITGLHLFHNPKPWGVILTCTLPYIMLIGLKLFVSVGHLFV